MDGRHSQFQGLRLQTDARPVSKFDPTSAAAGQKAWWAWPYKGKQQPAAEFDGAPEAFPRQFHFANRAARPVPQLDGAAGLERRLQDAERGIYPSSLAPLMPPGLTGRPATAGLGWIWPNIWNRRSQRDVRDLPRRSILLTPQLLPPELPP